MKKILILGAGEMQVPIIKKCGEMGIKTIVTDFSSMAPGLKFANISIIEDTTDKIKSLEIAKKFKVDGVLTTSDFPVNTLAYIVGQLGLPGISSKAAELCTNKYQQRQKLIENKFVAPQFIKANKNFKSWDLLNFFKFPLVVKPVDSSASRGVSKIYNFEELVKAFDEAIGVSRSQTILIEEFIDGPEFSVECLTQNGFTHVIAITEKSVIDSKFFIEERHIIPADLSDDQIKEISLYVKNIIKLFEIDNSATHTEIKLTKNGPVLIEIGARLGGDFIGSHLVPLANGIDMLRNVVLIAMNREIEVEKKISRYSGIQFIHKNNYDLAAKAFEQEDFCVIKKIDSYNDSTPKNSLDRLGYFIFQEYSRENLEFKLSLNHEDRRIWGG